MTLNTAGLCPERRTLRRGRAGCKYSDTFRIDSTVPHVLEDNPRPDRKPNGNFARLDATALTDC